MIARMNLITTAASASTSAAAHSAPVPASGMASTASPVTSSMASMASPVYSCSAATASPVIGVSFTSATHKQTPASRASTRVATAFASLSSTELAATGSAAASPAVNHWLPPNCIRHAALDPGRPG